MKSLLHAFLLSLPLTALAGDLKIDDFKGQYAGLSKNDACMGKIVIDIYQNRLRVYDFTNGSQVLKKELHNEKVRIGDELIQGEIEGNALIEKRYKLKRALGVTLSQKLISEVTMTKDQDQLQINDGTLSCRFALDLPEVVPPIEVEGQSDSEITKPASTDYVAVKKYFKSSDELLNADRVEDVLKIILKIKSATREYHNDLVEMLEKKDSFNAKEIALALQFPYFTAKDARNIELKIKEVREAKPVDDKLLRILTQNSHVASNFGSGFQNDLAQLLVKKTEEISVEEFKLILSKVYSENSDYFITDLLLKIKNLSLADKRDLIPELEKVEATDKASSFAATVFKDEHQDFNTDTLLSNPLNLNKETQIALVEKIGELVSDPNMESFGKLAEVLENSSAGLSKIARVFLTKIPVTDPSEILSMASKLINGSYSNEAYRDEFLLAAANQVTPLTLADADKLLKKMSSESKRAILFDRLIVRLTEELSVDSFISLVKNVKNGIYSNEQYRDEAVNKYYARIKQTESQENIPVLDLIASHSNRKKLALGIYGRDTTKTLADLIALALKVNNGTYSNEDYRDQVLVEGVKALTALTVSEMKLLEDTLSSNGKRLAQLKENVNKLPQLSVEDSKLLVSRISNGTYSNENYKDQALLIVLSKTTVSTQAEISALLAVALSDDTKRAILAVGYKLTLSAADLSLLVSSESNQVLKLEIIKKQAPKIAPLAAKEVIDLIKTVKNGTYSTELHKYFALTFLLDYVKASELADVKLLMEQRPESNSRVEIYKKLKVQLGAVTAANLSVIADLITNGTYSNEQYKDDLVVAESKLITSLSRDELVNLTDKVASSDKDRVLIVQMAPKLENFSDIDLSVLLLKIKNGTYSNEQYRDDTAVTLAPIVKSITTDGINSVIVTIGNHAKRKQVALNLLGRKTSVTKEDVLAVAANISNGTYSNENYKTTFLSEAILLIK